MNQTTIIKGEGIFPTPEPRIIYPTRKLLLKYYLVSIITWISITLAMYSILAFISILFSTESDSDYLKSFSSLAITFFIYYFILSFIILGPLSLFLWVYVKNMKYVVHGNEIVVYKGIITKSIKFCPYRNITNISTTAGPLDRLLNIGNVNIETAGAGNALGPTEKLEGLFLYQEIRDFILRVLREYQSSIKQDDTFEKHEFDKDKLQNIYLNEFREIKRLLRKLIQESGDKRNE